MDYGPAVREWVERTCREQGVPALVRDVATVLRVAAIFIEASDAPNRMETSDVNVLRSGGGRAHDNVVQHGGNYGPPLMEVELVPAAPQLVGLVDETAE